MMRVSLALIPGVISQFWIFGWGILLQIFLSCFSAIVSEALVLKLRNMNVIYNLNDKSAFLTGLLLAISIPPLSPWWMAVSGSAFAIIIAKHLYGGLGCNLFNPAMIGYALLLFSFPDKMINLMSPLEIKNFSLIDILNIIFLSKNRYIHIINNDTLFLYMDKGCDYINQIILSDMFNVFSLNLKDANFSEKIIEKFILCNKKIMYNNLRIVSFAYLIGGLFLIQQKIINWRIPVSFLTVLSTCTLVHYILFPNSLFLQKIYFFSCSIILSAFFILTDPVTSSITNKGRLVLGILAGFLTWFIQKFGSYIDGMAFVVLLTNISVPLIDYFTTHKNME